MSGGADHTNVPTPAGTRGPGNNSASIGIPNIDEKDWVAESTTANGAQAQTEPGVEHGIMMGKGGEMTNKTRRNGSIAVGSFGMK